MIGVVGNNNATGGIVSTDNTHTTIVPNGETWTGTAELNSYSGVMVQVATDQDGILYLEFSMDGTNWDTSISIPYDASSTNTPQPLYKLQRYFRARFTNNSGSEQTYFRLYTFFGSFGSLTSSISSSVSKSFPASVVRPTDYRYEVAMGKRQGRTTWNKFGYNADVDTGAAEIVASFGGTSPNIMTTADTLTLSSTSLNDIAGGTGARQIRIVGIGADFLSQTEDVTMNGTTSVETVNTWLGVNRCFVIESGSLRSNEGDITLVDTSVAVGIQARIPATNSVTQQCIFHTQINHTFLVDWQFVNVNKVGGSSPVVTVKGFSYSRVTNTTYEVFRDVIDTSVENNFQYTPSQPFIINGREVLYYTIETTVNNTVVNLRFSGIEEQIS